MLFKIANCPCSKVNDPCKYATYGSLIGASHDNSIDDPDINVPAAIIT